MNDFKVKITRKYTVTEYLDLDYEDALISASVAEQLGNYIKIEIIYKDQVKYERINLRNLNNNLI